MASVGVVVCRPDGRVLMWHSALSPARTSMEAEYQAVIVGLEHVHRHWAGARVHCMSDSRMVIDQINGRRAVRAEGLKPLHARAKALARAMGQVEFYAIPRELNELADALASFEVAKGQISSWFRRLKEESD